MEGKVEQLWEVLNLIVKKLQGKIMHIQMRLCGSMSILGGSPKSLEKKCKRELESYPLAKFHTSGRSLVTSHLIEEWKLYVVSHNVFKARTIKWRLLKIWLTKYLQISSFRVFRITSCDCFLILQLKFSTNSCWSLYSWALF